MAKTQITVEVLPSVWAFDDLELAGGKHEVEVTVAQHKAITAAAAAGVLRVKNADLHPSAVESDADSRAKQDKLEQAAHDPVTGSMDVAMHVAERDGTVDELLAYRADEEARTQALLSGEEVEPA